MTLPWGFLFIAGEVKKSFLSSPVATLDGTC